MSDRYASLKQGLVGCWIPSISGSGLLLPDLSGRGNNGSLVGMDASDWVSSQYGRALDFDGSNDAIDLGTSNTLNLVNEFTLALWVYQRTSGSVKTQMYLSRRSTASNYPFGFVSGVSDVIRLFSNAGSDASVSSDSAIALNAWQHIAVTRSGTAISFYINGRNAGNKTLAVGSSATNTFTSIAAQDFGSGITSVLDGQVDDVKIYSRALTEPEIKLLSSEPGIGFKRNTSAFATRYAYKPAKPRNYSVIRNRDPNYSTLRQGLVAAYCPSISGQGNVLPDLVGGNHGTLTNMTADDWVASGDGRALDFDGVDDYVQGNLRYYGTGAISFWVKTSTEVGAAVAFGVNASSADLMYIGLGQNISGTLTNELITVATIFGNARIEGYTTSDRNELLDNKWHHIAVVQRTANSSYEIYLDGIKKTTTVGDATLTSFGIGVASGDLIQFGSRRFTATQGLYLTGQLDDIRLYNRALTEPEIKLLASKRGIGLEPRKPKITFTDLGVQKTYSVVRVKETDYATLRQGLVGAWCPSLPNGGSGNTLPDVSGYGNHGSLVNMSPDDWVSGQYGRALDFDGTNDYVTGNATGLKIDAPITVSLFCYIRSITPNNNSALVDIKTSSSYGFVLQISSVGGLTYLFSDGVTTNNNITLSGSEIPALNQWNHLSLSFIGTSYKFTINGAVAKQGTIQGLATIQTAALDIGRRSTGVVGYADCHLDDIRIYNRALTESEIRLLSSEPGIGLRQESHRNTFYQFPSGARRKRILTGMP